VTEADWDRTLAVNTKGAFLMSQAALRVMSEGAGIVHIASIAGRSGYPNMVPYCASKFAVMGMMQAMAAELAPRRIRVNAICPGILGTAMWIEHLLGATGMDDGSNDREARFRELMAEQIPLGSPQAPADIAEAALYLANAENVTGTAITVAGGLVLG
jgi:meso-butanediol dehydrogenase/(S,S)-butanediol dehydrogenase/diacetyl reductase